MINGQLNLDWNSHWPLNNPAIEVLDDSEWRNQPDSVSEGGGEILIVSDSEGNESKLSADDESVASDTPSTAIEDV